MRCPLLIPLVVTLACAPAPQEPTTRVAPRRAATTTTAPVLIDAEARRELGRTVAGEDWRWAAVGAFVGEFLAHAPSGYSADVPLAVWLEVQKEPTEERSEGAEDDGWSVTFVEPPPAVLARWEAAGLPVTAPPGQMLRVSIEPPGVDGVQRALGIWGYQSWGAWMAFTTLDREGDLFSVEWEGSGQACF